jgi:hypothetical protein
MNIEPILNINGLNIYEYVVYKLKKPFYDDYLNIEVVSVHFVKLDDNIHVHFYSNPYVKNTYHPYYNECKDKIEIEEIDYENTMQHKKYLNNEIRKYEEQLNNFLSVESKARIEFENMKDRFRDVNLNEYIKVKLTDKGKEIYRNHYHDIDDEYVPTLDTDEEGYCKFQLWEFMHIFGEHFYMGGGLPCETNVKIQIRKK